MTVVNFTPLQALAGGALIGLGAAGLWWLLGRIAGISGILGGMLDARGSDSAWRIAFITGLLVAGIGSVLLFPSAIEFEMEAGYGRVIVAGLLVGIGTRVGGGCTSGHGVCGVSRLSTRSLAATAAFMLAGMFVVFLVRHLP